MDFNSSVDGREFVGDHAMQIGDFLVFRLDGCSSFSVLVFDATACEKEVAFLVSPCCRNVATINRLLSGKEAAVVDRPRLQDIDIVIHVNVDKKEVKDSKALVLSPVDVTVTEKRRKTRSINRLAVVAKVQRMPALILQRLPVTKEEAESALHKAKLFKSKNPIFHTVTYDSYVYTGIFMNVPSSFARLHPPKISHRITLWDENGKPWEVTYVYCSYRGGLGGG
ncbi:B3 domain-containing protein [Musa troglodytarum]|uniref:B3 domain-containing protein n=1 Tax=Musa troglodytarum TaxID=320322 RepID=A0A9E7EAF3_9LILI|nr:B3 domain-containing protein [Musa troglodytarum]